MVGPRGRWLREPPLWRNDGMRRLNVVELKSSLGDVLNRAEFQGECTVVHRRGKDAAAIISVEDLKLFERLLEEAEDRADVEAARAALAESDDRISNAEFRRRRGFNDESKPKNRRTRAKSV
jgi:prevent-host-death family protein